jgi:Pyruvate/2-oxoacid:ferredoxin oxidoreductase delta subunit
MNEWMNEWMQTIHGGKSAITSLNEGWTVLQTYTQKQRITLHQYCRKFCSDVHVFEA